MGEKMNSGIGCGVLLAIAMLVFMTVSYAIPYALQNSASAQAKMYEARAEYVQAEGVRDIMSASADSVRADTRAAHGIRAYFAPFTYTFIGVVLGCAPSIYMMRVQSARIDALLRAVAAEYGN